MPPLTGRLLDRSHATKGAHRNAPYPILGRAVNPAPVIDHAGELVAKVAPEPQL